MADTKWETYWLLVSLLNKENRRIAITFMKLLLKGQGHPHNY